jgi:hypothetical protein
MRPIYAKLCIVGVVVGVIALQIGLLFLPFGPIRTESKFRQAAASTEKTGRNLCVVCGAPAVSIKYRTNTGEIVTVNEYCAKHAPQMFNSLDKLSTNTEFVLFVGLAFAALSVIGAASGLAGLWARNEELENPKTLWDKFLSAPVWSLALYFTMSFFCFWLPLI